MSFLKKSYKIQLNFLKKQYQLSWYAEILSALMHKVVTEIWKSEKLYNNFICPKYTLFINFSSTFQMENYTCKELLQITYT